MVDYVVLVVPFRKLHFIIAVNSNRYKILCTVVWFKKINIYKIKSTRKSHSGLFSVSHKSVVSSINLFVILRWGQV